MIKERGWFLQKFLCDSISNIWEQHLAEHLLEVSHWRYYFLALLGISQETPDRQRVSLERLGQAGDVDILLCPAGPDKAVAIEVKRVKVRGCHVNKLAELELAVEQANRLARAGFWKVYLFVLIVIDTREQNGGTRSFAGLDSTTQSFITQAIRKNASRLLPQVGIVHYNFVQPMDSPALVTGTWDAHPLRPAEAIEQPAAVTRWVASLMRNLPKPTHK